MSRSEALFALAADRCVSRPSSETDYPFGEQTGVYKVVGKMFALLSTDREPAWLSLKLPPELSVELRETYPEQVLPGYYLNKKHWSTFVLDGVLPDAALLGYIDTSYELVRASLPARLRPAAL